MQQLGMRTEREGIPLLPSLGELCSYSLYTDANRQKETVPDPNSRPIWLLALYFELPLPLPVLKWAMMSPFML
jgi:hypothetical protein